MYATQEQGSLVASSAATRSFTLFSDADVCTKVRLPDRYYPNQHAGKSTERERQEKEGESGRLIRRPPVLTQSGHVVTTLYTADGHPAAPRRPTIRGSLPPEDVAGAEHREVYLTTTR